MMKVIFLTVPALLIIFTFTSISSGELVENAYIPVKASNPIPKDSVKPTKKIAKRSRSSTSTGNTWDLSESDADCKRPRFCKDISGGRCFPADGCYCQPDPFLFCLSNADCPRPEICVQDEEFLRKLCISPAALRFASFSDPGPAPTPPGDGLILSPCAGDSQCKGRRTCRFFYGSGFDAPCNGRKPCFCYLGRQCFTSADCEAGEVCANTAITDRAVCVSKAAEKELTSLSEVPSTVKNTNGYTLDPCREDSDCQRGRRCRQFRSSLPSCDSSSLCICLPPSIGCESTADCINEEVCVNTVYFNPSLCVSLEARAAFSDIETVTTPIVCPVLIKEDPPVRMLNTGSSRVAEIPLEAVDKLPKRLGYDKRLNAVRAEVDLKIPESVNIVGGRRVSTNLSRYMVLIATGKGRFTCSGVLLSPRWVLTAAHCETKKGFIARFGPRKAFTTTTEIRIIRVFSHPKYEITPDDFLFDVTVCELESDAPSGSKFMKLNKKREVPAGGSIVRSVGFGDVESGNDGNEILRQVDIRVTANKECTKVYETDSFDGLPVLDSSQICAGSLPRGGCGTCQGDSGGPLIQYENGDPVVLGLASFGIGCGDWKFPDVFARVSRYVNWISRNTPAVFTTNMGETEDTPGPDGSKRCKEGEFLSLSGMKCMPCSKTSVSKGGTVTECHPCKKGFVRDSSNGSKCSCEGKFAVGKGRKKQRCVKCRTGTFAGIKDGKCRKCPKGTTSSAGAGRCR